ncbi:hypothetical protein BS78_K231100 [Paspalum vaginatum]|uniref:CCHC-type domain-containing protein n=1 Tax=Paspalum vaginatum TaxID=158149 RepID=A0A9W7X849_9POAL|nr:hypothetical protein BS78_K231100 [Paspalum vaginatum]
MESPPPSTPASPPPSPPAATPAPAGTHQPASSHAGKSASYLSPAAAPFFPSRSAAAGRSKPRRWADEVEEEEGSSLGSLGSPAPYRDAVLRARNDWEAGSSAAPAAPPVLAPQLRSIVVRPDAATVVPRSGRPRVLAHPVEGPHGGRRRARVSPPDQDGWRRVLPPRRCTPPQRGASPVLGRHAPPRSSISPPAHLRDQCLNCLSFSHRVATCRLPRRCHRCRGFRHLARDCKRPRRAPGRQGRASRSVRARTDGSATPTGSEAMRSTPPSSPGAPAPDPSPMVNPKLPPGHHLLRPSEAVCIIDRSEDIAAEEASLTDALLVLAGNARRDINLEDARRAFTALPGIGLDDFVIKRSHPDNFIILPASAAVRETLLRARPVVVSGATLVLRPWTRLAHAVRTELLFKVKLEIVGIPPHAWSRDTAAKVLAPACWIEKVEASSSSKTDLSFFGVTAWTDRPSAIPRSVSLLIAEDELRVVHSDEALHRIFDHLPPYLRKKVTMKFRVTIHLLEVEDCTPSSPHSTPSSSSPSPPSSDDDGALGGTSFTARHHPGGGARGSGGCSTNVVCPTAAPRAVVVLVGPGVLLWQADRRHRDQKLRSLGRIHRSTGALPLKVKITSLGLGGRPSFWKAFPPLPLRACLHRGLR